MRHILPALLLAACTASASERPTAEQFAACGVDEAEHARLLSLSTKDFDQNFDGEGWRSIGQREGCSRVAGYLILDYVERHGLTPDDGSVTWHAAQMFADAGDTEKAITLFRKEYDPALVEGDDHYDWTLYGRGTVEFLQGDRDALEATIADFRALPVDQERIASMKRFAEENNVSFPPEVMAGKPANLVVLEGLLRCFDQPYSRAYGQCPTEEG